jgi:hypothetical protein
MALNNLMVDPGPDIFYDPEFRNVLEDHMTYLRETNSQIILIDPSDAYRWRGDFFGFLDTHPVKRQYHWLVMRINQFTSPNQFHEDVLAMTLPDFALVEQILQSHNSLPRIS